jgi:hypothetical protein
MDEQEQRMFIRFLAKHWKQCAQELTLHKAFLETLRQKGYEDVDLLLETLRTEPSLPIESVRRFEWLEELLPPPETEIREKEFLAKWVPSGRPN